MGTVGEPRAHVRRPLMRACLPPAASCEPTVLPTTHERSESGREERSDVARDAAGGPRREPQATGVLRFLFIFLFTAGAHLRVVPAGAQPEGAFVIDIEAHVILVVW